MESNCLSLFDSTEAVKSEIKHHLLAASIPRMRTLAQQSHMNMC